jgi:hypothetical protein
MGFLLNKQGVFNIYIKQYVMNLNKFKLPDPSGKIISEHFKL